MTKRTGRPLCGLCCLLLSACAQGTRPATFTGGTDAGPTADAGPLDAGLGLDGGVAADYLLRCASDAIDGGWDVYRVDVIGAPFVPDAGGQLVDGGFTLRAAIGPMHDGAADSVPVEIAATGTGQVQSDRVYDINVTFQGGLFQAFETYIPRFLEGQVQVNNAPVTSMLCWEPTPSQYHFQYDPASGTCRTDPGDETSMGYNFEYLGYLRETGDGQCAGLNGDLTEGDPTTPTLSGWDLRGAQFDMASLHSAHLVNARLEGADLSSLDYGSATITGSVDAFTRLPPGCAVTANQASCSR